MQKIQIGKSNLESTRLVYGCMRISGDPEKGKKAIMAAYDAGYRHFDHADIYGGGKSESLFGEVLKDKPDMRDEIIITSKCGIRGKDQPNPGDPARYDFDADYIASCVEGSLGRLNIETMDILLLHRPDYLFKADEVAGAFDKLHSSGKVRYFGVSNFKPSQVSLLQKATDFPLIMNQVEINIHNIDSIRDGTLDQCQELGITPEAWCPMGGVAYPAWGNIFTPEDESRIRVEFGRQSSTYGVGNTEIMLAWILKHPSLVLPIVGSTTPQRIQTAVNALSLDYTREDWYRLLEARNGSRVP